MACDSTCWLTWIVGILVLAVLLFRAFRKKIFASFCANMAKGKIFDSEKEKLFAKLTKEAEKVSPRKLKVLEIGGGSGSNFAFVKAPVDWTVTEPNLCFEPYFLESCAPHKDRHDIGKLVQAYGEDLGKFESESFDAVIITLVLCSVTSVEDTIKEIRRVLKPGGTFYFLEHIRAPDSSPKVQWFHDFISKTGIWPALFDGCYLNRETKTVLKKSGFSKVDFVDFITEFKMKMFLNQNPIPHACYGWATK